MQTANSFEGRVCFVSGSVKPGVGGLGVLIQITPHVRILVAVYFAETFIDPGRFAGPAPVALSKQTESLLGIR